ncbi:MAG: DUF1573 domain-containing protein [Planctomycetes bacterium]|nr:DUF1573 domain-containing protein [Planctomycetota bacterium]MBL7043324.1 DUF1573 domain-containing protein [Pirellulaceae bacterium]
MKKYIAFLPVLIVLFPLLIAFARGTKPATPDSVVLAKMLRAERDAIGARPKIVVPEPVYDFGIMDPLTTGTHDFRIRNDGDVPLELAPGSTTCKCTLSRITKPVIPPGESGTVRLTWNSGRKHPVYSHSANLHTNDPLKKTVGLRIKGIVRVQLGTAPAEIVLPRVEPDAPATTTALIYSQIWEGFTVDQVSCSTEGATWDIEPANTATLESLEAKSAHRITLTVPKGLSPGHFRGELHFRVKPSGEAKPESLDVVFSGKVVRRLAVYGPGVESTGTIDLGILRPRQGANRRLLMKVRDDHPDIEVESIETKPDFLHVKVTPYRTGTAATGLYHLDIAIPADAPECAFLGAKSAQIHLAIDHPRIEDLILKARFAIVADDRTL